MEPLHATKIYLAFLFCPRPGQKTDEIVIRKQWGSLYNDTNLFVLCTLKQFEEYAACLPAFHLVRHWHKQSSEYNKINFAHTL